MGRQDDRHRTYISTFSELTQEAHYPIGYVVLQNHAIFYEMGLRAPLDQLLGTGAFGSAFKIPSCGGSVLKLTRDPTELQAACLLNGRENRRIVHVHGVWALENTIGDRLRQWYVVHRGYLTPLDLRDTMLVEAIFQVYDDVALDLVIPRSPRQHATIDKWRGYLRDCLATGTADVGEESTLFQSLGNQSLQRAIRLLIQIGQAVDEMHRAGIDWEDIHPGNLMRNADKRLVIADFGWGQMHEDFDQEVQFLTPEVARKHVLAVEAETRADQRERSEGQPDLSAHRERLDSAPVSVRLGRNQLGLDDQ